MNGLWWILALGLGAMLVLQGVGLRIVHRRRLAALRARHLQLQHDMGGKFEQTKRQLAQLQSDLSAARLQLARRGKVDAVPEHAGVAARRALERELDEATAARVSSPADGFADTQVSHQETRPGSLLLQ